MLVGMATNLTSREIRLAGRPLGEPGPQHFELVRDAVPPLADGQILVRNTWMSVDPYMRGRMDDTPSYLPPFQVGVALEGSAVGEVVDSRSDGIPVGATVSHFLGWRDYAVVDAAAAQRGGRHGRAAAGVPRPARHHRPDRLRGADRRGARALR